MLILSFPGIFFNTTRYALLPTEDWSNDYYSPVGIARINTQDPSKNRSTKVWFYNPHPTQTINVTVETFESMSYEVLVNPGKTAASNPIPDGSGAHVISSMPFFALTQTDVEGDALGTSSDWGKYNFRWISRLSRDAASLVANCFVFCFGNGRTPSDSDKPADCSSANWNWLVRMYIVTFIRPCTLKHLLNQFVL